MILNIVSTVNGMENEGMRNVASHIVRELEGMCTVRRSGLGSPAQCLKNSIGADAVLIFARASAKTAYLAKALRFICPKVYFILVQKPEVSFMKKMRRCADRFSYFTILPKDGEELRALGASVRPLAVGIDKDKFRPAENEAEILSLRRKYGFDEDKPLVLHVGHLSAGRGLEEFLRLPKDRFQRLVVASGMFNSDEVEKRLLDDGVTVINEYLPDVSEIYRMADVYLFPTRSTEFVISIPLSVMEALACGIPVVAFRGVAGLGMINATEGSLVAVSDSRELEDTVAGLAERYFGNCKNLLMNTGSWADSAKRLLDGISENKSHSGESK